MATPAEIAAQPSGSLDDLERELIRDILGINGRAGDAVYAESETRIIALSATQRQVARSLIYIDYPDVNLDTTKVKGGSKGLDLDPERTKVEIRNKLRRMLYPNRYNDPENDFDNTTFIQSIPVTYNSGTTDYD